MYLVIRNWSRLKGLDAWDALLPIYIFELSFHSASAFGFALMSGIISYISQLAYSAGPAVLICASCQWAETSFISAITTSLFILLHIAWHMFSFDGWFKRHYWQNVWVISSHLATSYSVRRGLCPWWFVIGDFHLTP